MMSTSDPFALVLHFYAQFQRSKLNKDDLERIVKKYQNKPHNLLTDLSNKYTYWTIPTEIPVAAISRYLALYDVPQSYRLVMQRDKTLATALQCTKYDARFDPLHENFDPLVVLGDRGRVEEENKLLIVSASHKPHCLDNISRISTILKPHCQEVSCTIASSTAAEKEDGEEQEEEGTRKDRIENNNSVIALVNRDFLSSHYLHDLKYAPPPPPQARSTSSSSTVRTSANGSGDSSATQILPPVATEVTRRKHLFEMIADYSVPQSRTRNDKGETITLESPLVLLKQFMMNKERVRVILRRRNSIRGHLDGFIRAFDKHFNLFMYDVDEEYITNKQKKRTTGFGKFLNQHNVLHRHLPQLIVRGDIVVSVFRVPRSPLLLPVADLSMDQLRIIDQHDQSARSTH